MDTNIVEDLYRLSQSDNKYELLAYVEKHVPKKVRKNILDLLAPPTPTLRTEDTGKELEMAICMAYGIEFVGKYKYSYDEPRRLAERLKRLPVLKGIYHSAEKGGVYDFTSEDGNLSAKSTKKDGKVAPQRVGQASVEKFCERMGIPEMNEETLKVFIQENVATLLPVFEENTFSCDIVYYKKHKDELSLIKRISPVDWSKCSFTWTRTAQDWNNSATLKVDGKSVMEIQFHHGGRTNMACRWCWDNLLSTFASHFEVVFL